MDTKELLESEIREELESIGTVAEGTEEKKNRIDDLSQLYKLKIESERIETDKMKAEKEFEAARIAAETAKKDRIAELVKAGVTTVIPIIAYMSMIAKGFKFEETGIFRSTTMRNLFSGFRLRF